MGERLVYRGDETSFEFIEADRTYAFDADGGLPADLGLKSDYRYGVVNEHTVLVEAKTHKITQIIN